MWLGNGCFCGSWSVTAYRRFASWIDRNSGIGKLLEHGVTAASIENWEVPGTEKQSLLVYADDPPEMALEPFRQTPRYCRTLALVRLAGGDFTFDRVLSARCDQLLDSPKDALTCTVQDFNADPVAGLKVSSAWRA